MSFARKDQAFEFYAMLLGGCRFSPMVLEICMRHFLKNDRRTLGVAAAKSHSGVRNSDEAKDF